MIKQFIDTTDENFNNEILNYLPVRRIIVETENETTLTINQTALITFTGIKDFDVSDRSEFAYLLLNNLSENNIITIYA